MALKDISHYVTRPGKTLGDPDIQIPISQDLATVPGIPLRDDDLTCYDREYPLESVSLTDSAAFDFMRPRRKYFSEGTENQSNSYDEYMKPYVKWVKDSGDMEPTGTPTGEDVTEKIRQKARELGCVEVGFTAMDERYVYTSKRKDIRQDLPHAICLSIEQDYEMTKMTPSVATMWTHDDCYERQALIAQEMTALIHELGYSTQVNGPAISYGPMIPLFVNAGLGQLGANGIIMSPHIGPWTRLQVIMTDAKVTYTEPVDYGIHAFCQICQVCTNRCPGRAIAREKVWYRGTHKNKIFMRRCIPMLSRYQACGVCMKTCPIGVYGMKPVMDHYVETGEVLGKGTHDLEGYTLPEKGYFGPGELPRFDNETFALPRGRSEDWMFIEFRDQLQVAKEDGIEDTSALWGEFQQKIEKTFNREFKSDMAMDMPMEDESGGELN
jgi:ferredoxin